MFASSQYGVNWLYMLQFVPIRTASDRSTVAVFNGRANQLVCHTGPSTGNVQSTVAYPGFHFGSIYLTKF